MPVTMPMIPKLLREILFVQFLEDGAPATPLFPLEPDRSIASHSRSIVITLGFVCDHNKNVITLAFNCDHTRNVITLGIDGNRL